MYPCQQVVDTSKKISDIPEWFCDCRLNFAENLLKHPEDDKVAIITCGECEIILVPWGTCQQHVMVTLGDVTACHGYNDQACCWRAMMFSDCCYHGEKDASINVDLYLGRNVMIHPSRKTHPLKPGQCLSTVMNISSLKARDKFPMQSHSLSYVVAWVLWPRP